MKTLADFGYDGEAAIAALLKSSEYRSIEQAVASLTLFTHPETVKQTRTESLFRIRRYKQGEKRGQVLGSERVVLCDNDSPTRVFLWSNNLKKYDFREVQYNHIYQKAYNPDYYTSLANICVTPAFLSKLTDKNPSVIQLLKYRVMIEYNFLPNGEQTPTKPVFYDSLQWAQYLPACADLKNRLEQRLESNPKSRIAISVRHFGWRIIPNSPDQYPP